MRIVAAMSRGKFPNFIRRLSTVRLGGGTKLSLRPIVVCSSSLARVISRVNVTCLRGYHGVRRQVGTVHTVTNGARINVLRSPTRALHLEGRNVIGLPRSLNVSHSATAERLLTTGGVGSLIS